MTSLPNRRDVVCSGAEERARLVTYGERVEPLESRAAVTFLGDGDAFDCAVRIFDRARHAARQVALVCADIVRRGQGASRGKISASIEPNHSVRQRAARSARALRIAQQVRAIPVRQIARLSLIGA